MREILGQINLPTIPYTTTGNFLLGMLGVLLIVGTLLWIWNQGQKAFGRTPPMNEELDKRDKALRKMIFASENNLKERMTRLENLYVEMQADRLRKWDELQKEFGELKSDLSFIRGRFEKKDQS